MIPEGELRLISLWTTLTTHGYHCYTILLYYTIEIMCSVFAEVEFVSAHTDSYQDKLLLMNYAVNGDFNFQKVL